MTKKDFPFFSNNDVVYLDSAATTHKPSCVINAISDFYCKHYATVHRTLYSSSTASTTLYENSRQKVKKFFNVDNDGEIVFTKGTTESINLVAKCFGKMILSRDDEIILSEIEHHSNIIPWILVAKETGAKIKIAKVLDNGDVDMDNLLSLMSKRVKIVTITHMSNFLGSINPIKEIANIAHNFGAKIVVDGAQSCGHLSVDLSFLDVDFFACSGHKMFGPTGIGVLYGKKELLDMMPTYQTGGGMAQEVSLDSVSYNCLPYKFEAGTPPIAEAIGLAAAIEYMGNFGVSNIYDVENRTIKYARKLLENMSSIKILGNPSKHGGILSFISSKAHPLDIGTMLDIHGIAVRTGHFCCQPGLRRFGENAAIRISLSIYNDCNDIDKLVESLERILKEISPLTWLSD